MLYGQRHNLLSKRLLVHTEDIRHNCEFTIYIGSNVTLKVRLSEYMLLCHFTTDFSKIRIRRLLWTHTPERIGKIGSYPCIPWIDRVGNIPCIPTNPCIPWIGEIGTIPCIPTIPANPCIPWIDGIGTNPCIPSIPWIGGIGTIPCKLLEKEGRM